MSYKGKTGYKCDMMMQVNMYNCNINSMNMMMGLDEESPDITTVYRITAKDPGSDDVYNLRIDDTQSEPRIILTKDKTDTMWTIMGDLNVINPLIAIGRVGMNEYWTVVDDVPWVSFRQLGSMGNLSQFFILTDLGDNQFYIGRVRTDSTAPPMFLGSNTIPIKEGSIIYSDAGPIIFMIEPI